MAINASKVKSKSTRVPQPLLKIGGYPGRLLQVIDLGIHLPAPWKGVVKPAANFLHTLYELSDEFIVDEKGELVEDKPRVMGEMFPIHNLKADKAKSTVRYSTLDPELSHKGDWSKLLGSPCTVVVVNNTKDGTTYNNIGNISTAPTIKGYKQPELINPPKFFDFDEPNLEVFESLPEWLQEKIQKAINFPGSELESLIRGETPAPKAANAAPQQEPDDVNFDDDIPF